MAVLPNCGFSQRYRPVFTSTMRRDSPPAVNSVTGRDWIGLVECYRNQSLEHLRIVSGYWHANYAARLVDNPFWVAFTASKGIRKSVSEPVGRIIRNELRIDNRSITSCAIAA